MLHFTSFLKVRKLPATVTKVPVTLSLIKAELISKGICSKQDMPQRRELKAEGKTPGKIYLVASSTAGIAQISAARTGAGVLCWLSGKH